MPGPSETDRPCRRGLYPSVPMANRLRPPTVATCDLLFRDNGIEGES